MSATATAPNAPRGEAAGTGQPSAGNGLGGVFGNDASTATTGSTDQHAGTVEEREALEYWGYLFKPDKTGTDKLKGLLRGLKQVMVRDTMNLLLL